MKHAREDYNRIQDPEFLIPQDEPVMLFRGQDEFAGRALRFYAAELEAHGVDAAMIASVRDHAQRMDLWPVKKTPDLTLILPEINFACTYKTRQGWPIFAMTDLGVSGFRIGATSPQTGDFHYIVSRSGVYKGNRDYDLIPESDKPSPSRGT